MIFLSFNEIFQFMTYCLFLHKILKKKNRFCVVILFHQCKLLSCKLLSVTFSASYFQVTFMYFHRGRSTRYSDRLHDFSITIPRCYKDVYVNSFFPRTARLWNSLPIECFPLTYDLSGFKSRINRYLLTVGSF